MRELIILWVLIGNNSFFAQNINSDSISKNLKHKIFNVDSQTKHNHIIDFTGSVGFISYRPYLGAIGYRYIYNTGKLVNPGFRVGIWSEKTGEDIPEESARKSFIYSLSGFVEFPIWKSVGFQLSSEFCNWISMPTKTNTIDNKNYYYSQPILTEKVSVNCTIFNHYYFELGFGLVYNSKSTKWNHTSLLSIGYKF